MKKIILVFAILLSISSFGQSFPNDAISNNAIKLSPSWGDLSMRRYIDNDLNWKRALVPLSGSTLILNFAGDFTGGTRVMGSKHIIDGNVGIGTLNPTEKLSVNGKILCEEVEVIQDVLPDYVFQHYYTGFSTLKENYKMLTLEEVETFTKANHHLPEVPSAAEVKENGMQLKEMTTILLQKIEELTLYTIEQEKRIKALETKLVEKKS